MTSTMPSGKASRLEMESLYESNLALKAEFNRTKEENKKLRTMNKRLEKENEKKTVEITQLSQQPHLKETAQVEKMNIIRSLKNTI